MTTPAVDIQEGAVGAVVFPIPAIGHYRINHRCALVATQAANSRLFSFRNAGANLLVPTRLIVKVLQVGAFTAQIEDSLDCFRCTTFTVSDGVNTVTPVASVKRTSMVAAPGGAEIRGVTVAGAAAGMTGGTLTKDTGSFGQLPALFQAAVPTASQVLDTRIDLEDDVNGTHPFAFAANEGFEIENRVLLGAAAAASVYIDFSWAELLPANY